MQFYEFIENYIFFNSIQKTLLMLNSYMTKWKDAFRISNHLQKVNKICKLYKLKHII